MRTTPPNITSLQENEVFTFGSNLAGEHKGGAARAALDKFGAVYGNPIGLQGQSYAIPTLGLPKSVSKKEYIELRGRIPYDKLSIDQIGVYVNEFIDFAKSRPDMTFYVTEVGCSIAKNTPEEIAPLFKEARGLENVYLPESFWSC